MSASPEIEIAGRRIGADHPPYLICELSGNHNGSLERALSLIDAAAATGCDAIKIQTYTADTITLEGGAAGVALLHCVSSYPAELCDANVRTVADMAGRFESPVGLSDHTHGTAASVAAIAMGASVVEKHFTLARADGGPDAAFSLEPAEFTALVRDCKDAWTAL